MGIFEGKMRLYRGYRLWVNHVRNPKSSFPTFVLGNGLSRVMPTGGSSAVEQWTVKLPCAVIHWSVVQIHLPGIFIFKQVLRIKFVQKFIRTQARTGDLSRVRRTS